MKVETNIVANITANLIGEAVILVLMYVKTFKSDIIVFIFNVIMMTDICFQIKEGLSWLVVEFRTIYAISAYHH